jgi:hypothetical protein
LGGYGKISVRKGRRSAEPRSSPATPLSEEAASRWLNRQSAASTNAPTIDLPFAPTIG